MQISLTRDQAERYVRNARRPASKSLRDAIGCQLYLTSGYYASTVNVELTLDQARTFIEKSIRPTAIDRSGTTLKSIVQSALDRELESTSGDDGDEMSGGEINTSGDQPVTSTDNPGEPSLEDVAGPSADAAPVSEGADAAPYQEPVIGGDANSVGGGDTSVATEVDGTSPEASNSGESVGATSTEGQQS